MAGQMTAVDEPKRREPSVKYQGVQGEESS